MFASRWCGAASSGGASSSGRCRGRCGSGGASSSGGWQSPPNCWTRTTRTSARGAPASDPRCSLRANPRSAAAAAAVGAPSLASRGPWATGSGSRARARGAGTLLAGPKWKGGGRP